ncbi:hypothetical protein PT974_00205 [Cladobotryum mycophilum]|uniref:Uncharacterized protein n=1 Tax=Cladobotryum mycophilum TaxID=491253 RepID=A0ABR0T0A3_9HYPO
MLFKPLVFITMALSAFQVQAITASEIVKDMGVTASQMGELQEAVGSLSASNVGTVGAVGSPVCFSLLDKQTKDLRDVIGDRKNLQFSDNDKALIENA